MFFWSGNKAVSPHPVHFNHICIYNCICVCVYICLCIDGWWCFSDVATKPSLHILCCATPSGSKPTQTLTAQDWICICILFGFVSVLCVFSSAVDDTTPSGSKWTLTAQDQIGNSPTLDWKLVISLSLHQFQSFLEMMRPSFCYIIRFVLSFVVFLGGLWATCLKN